MGARGKFTRKTRAPPVSFVTALKNGTRMRVFTPARVNFPKGSMRGGIRRSAPPMRLGKRMSTGKFTTFHYKLKLATTAFTALDVWNLNVGGGVNATGGQLYMSFCNAYYVPIMIYNMIRNFTMYRPIRFRLLYRTRIGTSVTCNLICSYFKDPSFFEARAVASSLAAVTDAMLSTATSCGQWPAWKNMDCPTIMFPKWMYSVVDTLSGAIDLAGNTSNLRGEVAGAYGILGVNNPTPSVAITFGDFYLECDVQVKDMVQAQTSNVGVDGKPVTQHFDPVQRNIHRILRRLDAYEEKFGRPATVQDDLEGQVDERLDEKSISIDEPLQIVNSLGLNVPMRPNLIDRKKIVKSVIDELMDRKKVVRINNKVDDLSDDFEMLRVKEDSIPGATVSTTDSVVRSASPQPKNTTIPKKSSSWK